MQDNGNPLGGHGDYEDALSSSPPDVAGGDAGVEDLRSPRPAPLVSTSEAVPAGAAAPFPGPPIVEVEAAGGHYGE